MGGRSPSLEAPSQTLCLTGRGEAGMGQWFSAVLSFAFWGGVQLALKKKWFGSPNSSGHSNSPETLRLGVPMVTHKEH